MKPIAEEFSLKLIEDATESLGAFINNQHCGTFGSCGCFSFNGNKMITTGGGGMIVTDDDQLASQVRHLSTQAKSNNQEYVHDQTGFNYRLTNIQAAIGCAQLEVCNDILFHKRRIRDRYDQAFAKSPFINTPTIKNNVKPANWLYTIQILSDKASLDAREIILRLSEKNIITRPLWQPMHLSPSLINPIFIGAGISETLYSQSISLPCSPTMTDDQQDFVIHCLQDLLST
ncbi:DegT/DnrJ/EryC1/StrS family aminotransferase [Terasakiella sp.]|uniref:DegT/DnrJ/EryC1/StrS family aminotransferase n=1 Tax=Terasakiella sp. TaxID=2034861 RepID=UPI003AA9A3B3